MSCQQNGLREAELTDWKDNRHFRLMAVDHGLLTWTDVPHRADGSHWPLILVTWPPGADTRAGDREPLYRLVTSTHIRLLVFSPIRVVRVTITLDTGEQVECSTDTGTWLGADPHVVAPRPVRALYGSGRLANGRGRVRIIILVC